MVGTTLGLGEREVEWMLSYDFRRRRPRSRSSDVGGEGDVLSAEPKKVLDEGESDGDEGCRMDALKAEKDGAGREILRLDPFLLVSAERATTGDLDVERWSRNEDRRLAVFNDGLEPGPS